MTENVSVLSSDVCRQEGARCIACGTCLTVCPVFGEDAQERLTARGRNARLPELFARAERHGASDVTEKCLLCGRCAMVCPRGIPNDHIVASLRAVAAKCRGLPPAKGIALRSLLANRKRMGRALRLAAMLQNLLPATKGVALGLDADTPPPVRHFPLFLSRLAKNRNLPSLNPPFLSERLPDVTPATRSTGKPVRAAFFAGCAMEFAFPQAGGAIVNLLSDLGMEVLFPREQGCCGIAMHANGDVETALAMARHNADVLESCGADIVVTGCATCGSALRDMWPKIAPSTESARFAALADKTRDFSEILLAHSFPEPFPYVSRLPGDATVTWHSPCHLTRHQNVRREPLTLLARTLGGRFAPLPSRCCGFGGSFNVTQYPLSKDIGARKSHDLKEMDAAYIVTSCPGCMIQLSDMAAQNGIRGKVIHLAEALDRRR